MSTFKEVERGSFLAGKHGPHRAIAQWLQGCLTRMWFVSEAQDYGPGLESFSNKRRTLSTYAVLFTCIGFLGTSCDSRSYMNAAAKSDQGTLMYHQGRWWARFGGGDIDKARRWDRMKKLGHSAKIAKEIRSLALISAALRCISLDTPRYLDRVIGQHCTHCTKWFVSVGRQPLDRCRTADALFFNRYVGTPIDLPWKLYTNMDLSILRVSIEPHLLPLPEPQLKLDLKVHNDFDHPVTIQIWDTPLDPRCALLGIIEILDTTTNALLPIDKVNFSRRMPPPAESFIQINSGSGVTNSVSIPNVALKANKEYRIKAKGRWKAVWNDAIDRIDAHPLETLAEAFSGDFASNAANIKPG